MKVVKMSQVCIDVCRLTCLKSIGGWLAQQRRLNFQTCRALVYRHSCIVFALAWFYRRISLPPAVELESEHSLLSFSLSQRDILWASKTAYVRDMTGLWAVFPLIR